MLARNGLLTGHSQWAATVAGLLGLVVVSRRRWPLTVTWIVLVGNVLCYAPAALIVALYTVGSRLRSRSVVLGVIAVAALVSELWAAAPGGRGLDLVHGVPFVAAPLLTGLFAATQQQLNASVRERAAALEREQVLIGERVRADERTRIAGELHDVVAHRVSHVVLTAGALGVSADRGPHWVRAEAERIRRTGVQALQELREVLGVLTAGQSGSDGPLEPMPAAADLDVMVADCRHLGMDVRLALTGQLEDLPAATQLTVYRVVQESLTNALKHAPGAAVTAEVECREEAVHVQIANGPAATAARTDLPSGGHGLLGLAERLRVMGGTFYASDQPGGGFLVQAHMPVHRTQSTVFLPTTDQP
ncbi:MULTISPECIES: sensor histidine kinase [unclassified Streptomyces]|uniref:sensor histidine kinase n=1 Tax=unclassified Streptomyces TaxID=2593676 RepID=UPI00380111B0